MNDAALDVCLVRECNLPVFRCSPPCTPQHAAGSTAAPRQFLAAQESSHIKGPEVWHLHLMCQPPGPRLGLELGSRAVSGRVVLRHEADGTLLCFGVGSLAQRVELLQHGVAFRKHVLHGADSMCLVLITSRSGGRQKTQSVDKAETWHSNQSQTGSCRKLQEAAGSCRKPPDLLQLHLLQLRLQRLQLNVIPSQPLLLTKTAFHHLQRHATQ